MTKYILLALALSFSAIETGYASDDNTTSRAEQGRKIAFSRRKGNCLACHAVAGGEFAGNVGPPLVAMLERYPDPEKLRAQIWDASVREPSTRMPPYGRHRILTEDEIDLLVEFILTL